MSLIISVRQATLSMLTRHRAHLTPVEYVLLLAATGVLLVLSVQPSVMFLLLFPYNLAHLWRLFALGNLPWRQTVLLVLSGMFSVAVFVMVLLGALRKRYGRAVVALVLLGETGVSAMLVQLSAWLPIGYAVLSIYYVPRILVERQSERRQ